MTFLLNIDRNTLYKLKDGTSLYFPDDQAFERFLRDYLGEDFLRAAEYFENSPEYQEFYDKFVQSLDSQEEIEYSHSSSPVVKMGLLKKAYKSLGELLDTINKCFFY